MLCFKAFTIFGFIKIFPHLLLGKKKKITPVYRWACAVFLIFMLKVQANIQHARKTWLNVKLWIDSICFFSHKSCRSLPVFIFFFIILQIENYIKESMKAEMAQLQQSAVHNHTAAMLEMGTNLLSQTAEQTRKLTDVETQVKAPPLPLPNA